MKNYPPLILLGFLSRSLSRRSCPRSLSSSLSSSLSRSLPRSLQKSLSGISDLDFSESRFSALSRNCLPRFYLSGIGPGGRPVSRPSCRPMNDRARSPFSRTGKKENPNPSSWGKKRTRRREDEKTGRREDEKTRSRYSPSKRRREAE